MQSIHQVYLWLSTACVAGMQLANSVSEDSDQKAVLLAPYHIYSTQYIAHYTEYL